MVFFAKILLNAALLNAKMVCAAAKYARRMERLVLAALNAVPGNVMVSPASAAFLLVSPMERLVLMARSVVPGNAMPLAALAALAIVNPMVFSVISIMNAAGNSVIPIRSHAVNARRTAFFAPRISNAAPVFAIPILRPAALGAVCPMVLDVFRAMSVVRGNAIMVCAGARCVSSTALPVMRLGNAVV